MNLFAWANIFLTCFLLLSNFCWKPHPCLCTFMCCHGVKSAHGRLTQASAVLWSSAWVINWETCPSSCTSITLRDNLMPSTPISSQTSPMAKCSSHAYSKRVLETDDWYILRYFLLSAFAWRKISSNSFFVLAGIAASGWSGGIPALKGNSDGSASGTLQQVRQALALACLALRLLGPESKQLVCEECVQHGRLWSMHRTELCMQVCACVSPGWRRCFTCTAWRWTPHTLLIDPILCNLAEHFSTLWGGSTKLAAFDICLKLDSKLTMQMLWLGQQCGHVCIYPGRAHTTTSCLVSARIQGLQDPFKQNVLSSGTELSDKKMSPTSERTSILGEWIYFDVL